MMTSTILICDDEAVLRELVRASLSERPFRLLEARDGDEALELAREHRPDLIVIDMMMPGRSGLDVVREVRSDPELAATPVILLTARAQAADRAVAEAAGVDRFVAKPFSPQSLVAAIDELLAERGAAA
jgi:two-component system phosphate regulon response regulator PhoB